MVYGCKLQNRVMMRYLYRGLFQMPNLTWNQLLSQVISFPMAFGVEVPLPYVLWWNKYLDESLAYSKESTTSRILWEWDKEYLEKGLLSPNKSSRTCVRFLWVQLWTWYQQGIGLEYTLFLGVLSPIQLFSSVFVYTFW